MNAQSNNNNLSENLLPLTQEEIAIIFGTLLGDAHIQKRGNNSYRLKITHSTKQRSYVQWLRGRLRRLCTTTQEPVIRTDKKGYETIEFYLSSGIWLRYFFDLFYVEIVENNRSKYVKQIRQELIDALPMDAMLLAIFFMDDGSVRNDCYAGKLATQGFTEEENNRIALYLRKWGIETRVVLHLRERNQYSINIPAVSFGDFVKIVEPIISELPDMVYKLNYENKPRND